MPQLSAHRGQSLASNLFFIICFQSLNSLRQCLSCSARRVRENLCTMPPFSFKSFNLRLFSATVEVASTASCRQAALTVPPPPLSLCGRENLQSVTLLRSARSAWRNGRNFLMNETNAFPMKRLALFSSWALLTSLVFIRPVIAWVQLSLSQDDASYLVIIPFTSAAVLYLERRKIFLHVFSDKTTGVSLLLLAAALGLTSRFLGSYASLGLQLTAWILTLVTLWVAGFAFFFGRAAAKAAQFPLLFLLLMIPIPGFLLDRITLALQEGSAWITGIFFDLAGVPALREGLVFHLARVTIEVAKECSGIRSSMALLILALLVAHFRLNKISHQILLVACGLFMMIVKNGIRIATLTLLAIYVDPGFLFGRLHHQGGVVFFVLALLLLLPLLTFLERRESKQAATAATL